MKKGDAPVVVDHVFVAGAGSFYAYCAIVVYKNPSLAGRVQKELWDYFQTSPEMSTWDPDLGSGSVSDNVALTDILCTLATRVYPLNARLYNNRFENGHRDYNAPLENVVKRHAPLFMSLHLASDGELTMHVLRNQKTGESRVPTRVINVLTRTQEKEDDAAALGNNSNRPDESSQYSLAVFDNKTRAHMQIAARFRLSPNKTVHYMEFDLGLSRLEPAWNIILKGVCVCVRFELDAFSKRKRLQGHSSVYLCNADATWR